MSLTLTEKRVQDVLVLKAQGRVTLGEGSHTLQQKIDDLIAEGNKKIVLDMAGVEYVDSSGLGTILSSYTTLANRGGAIKLLGVGGRFKDLLQITKLACVFDFFEDEVSAVKSFF